MDVFGHLKTISRHKYLVTRGCFQVGLYKQGLLHDLSKYSPTEFWIGCQYYQGNRSPNNAERENLGVSLAWLHHKGRNRHHFEYWIDYSSEPGQEIQGQKMPARYVVEMFIDRVAASKVYLGKNYTDQEPLKYFEKGTAKLENMIHPETKRLLHGLLKMLADEGEDATYAYIRSKITHARKRSRVRRIDK